MLIRAWIVIKSELGAKMPVLVGSDFHTDAPDNRALDCNTQRAQGSSFPILGDKQEFWTPPNHGGSDLVAECVETVGKYLGQLKLKRLLVLGFVRSDQHQRGFALPLRPMKMLIELKSAEVFDPRRQMKKNVDRQGCLHVHTPAFRERPVSPICAPQHVGQIDQLAEQPWVIEPAQHGLVFLGQS